MIKIEIHNHFELDFHLRKDFNFSNIMLNTCIIVDEAMKRGIKAEFVLEKYLELKYEGKKALFQVSDNSSLSHLAKKIAASKFESKEFLQRAGVRVPKGRRFTKESMQEIGRYSESLGEEVVVKPEYGSEGRLVYCGVTPANLRDIVSNVRRKYNSLVIEEQIDGKVYRFTATTDGYVIATRKRPASVLGDGQKNIEALIEEKNQDRQTKNRSPILYPFYTIVADEIVTAWLERQNLGLDYVPKNEERIFLRNNSNTSTGGDSINIPPKDIHPMLKNAAVNALKAIPGMSYAGIDIITDDITHPAYYAVIELNNMPGLVSPTFPYIGPPQNPAGALLNLVLPASNPEKIEK